MGRRLPPTLSQLGWRIFARLRELRLQPADVAAAAGISASTLYRLMSDGKTVAPRLRTKRRLALVLQVPMVELFQDGQLEIPMDSPIGEAAGEPLEHLLIHQYRSVPDAARPVALSGAAVALLEIALAVDPSAVSFAGQYVGIEQPRDEGEAVLIALFRRLPDPLQRDACKAAVLAMLNVCLAADGGPNYSAVGRTAWAVGRLRRAQPLE